MKMTNRFFLSNSIRLSTNIFGDEDKTFLEDQFSCLDKLLYFELLSNCVLLTISVLLLFEHIAISFPQVSVAN